MRKLKNKLCIFFYTGRIIKKLKNYTNILTAIIKTCAYANRYVLKFPFGEDFNNILKKIGFIRVEALPQTFGVATIYTASKK